MKGASLSECRNTQDTRVLGKYPHCRGAGWSGVFTAYRRVRTTSLERKDATCGWGGKGREAMFSYTTIGYTWLLSGVMDEFLSDNTGLKRDHTFLSPLLMLLFLLLFVVFIVVDDDG